jgi:uncharacterized protein YxjI
MKKYIPYVIIIFLIYLVCVLYTGKKQQDNNVTALRSEVSSYKLKNGKLILSVKTLQLSKKDIVQDPIIKEFVKVNTIIKYKTKTVFDTLKIAYKDSVQCKFERTGTLLNDKYSLDYKSDEKGIIVQNLSLKDSIIIVAGIKRKWFLGKETQTLDISNTNDLIKISNPEHIEIVKKTKWYQSTFFKVGIGVLAGALLK